MNVPFEKFIVLPVVNDHNPVIFPGIDAPPVVISVTVNSPVMIKLPKDTLADPVVTKVSQLGVDVELILTLNVTESESNHV
jgi:hypothetical protein